MREQARDVIAGVRTIYGDDLIGDTVAGWVLAALADVGLEIVERERVIRLQGAARYYVLREGTREPFLRPGDLDPLPEVKR